MNMQVHMQKVTLDRTQTKIPRSTQPSVTHMDFLSVDYAGFHSLHVLIMVGCTLYMF